MIALSCQYLSLSGFHYLAFRVLHMVIAAQMQHAVGNQEGQLPFPGMAILFCLLNDLLHRNNDISQNQFSGIRIEIILYCFLHMAEIGFLLKINHRKG